MTDEAKIIARLRDLNIIAFKALVVDYSDEMLFLPTCYAMTGKGLH
jgi:hypothetical protein